jgi:hypothetical protein
MVQVGSLGVDASPIIIITPTEALASWGLRKKKIFYQYSSTSLAK